MTEDDRKALVARPSAALEKASVGAESVLSRIVADALVLARSRASSLASARFRVGRYEFRDADHRQILLWAKALEKTPEKIIETLENQHFDLAYWPYPEGRGHDVISFRVEDGAIYSLVWDNEILPLTEFVWVQDLNIREIAFNDRHGKLTAISPRLPTLRRLVCSHIGLRELDLSNVPRLTHLYCSRNSLTKLDLSNI
jgi:hypothetical protein